MVKVSFSGLDMKIVLITQLLCDKNNDHKHNITIQVKRITQRNI